MIRIYLSLFLLLIGGASLQAQHFDDLYNQLPGPTRTWRDSGYYFIPTIVRFEVLTQTIGPQGVASASVIFRSTDNSQLTFNGQAVFFYRPDNLPGGVNIAAGTRGLATVVLPQDLLYCPDEEEEQGMGQDDPYFPLSLVGCYERIGTMWLDDQILVGVQLNDFVVN